MNIEDSYYYLDETDQDWDFHGIFADWLFENNHPELEKAHRFCILHKKYPRFSNGIFCWGADNINNHHYIKNYPHIILNEDLWKMVPSNDKNNNWKFYPSLHEAYYALGKALYENRRFLYLFDK